MAELNKRNPGILGYDPAKIGADRSMKQIQCPHCWFAHHSKSIVTRHINDEHWDLKEYSKGQNV